MNARNRLGFLVTSLCFSVMFVCGGARRAEAQSRPWDGPAFSADPAAIRAAAAEIPHDPNAEVTVFLDERYMVLDAEQRMKETLHRVYRVESQQGVEEWASVEWEWSPWRQKRPEIRARVIGPEGTVYPLDPKVLSDAPAHDERPELYDDERVFSGPLPAIAVGTIVEEEYVEEDTAPLFAAGLTRRVYFGRRSPVLRTVLTIEAPAALPLRYTTRLVPDAQTKKTEANGTTSLRIEQGPLKAIETNESDLPDDVPIWPAVDFSTGVSWNAVAATYYHAIEGSVRPADVGALLEGSKGLSGDALLRELVTTLHRQVRYTGVEFGISSLIPHPPQETVGHKYGDCKDKAIVLVSVLKAAGISAELALLFTRGADDVAEDLPGMGQFDHAIVYIPGSPGTWIDATAEYFVPGSLPWADQGRLALLISPETKGLVRIPVAVPRDNLEVEKREFTLAEYGPARIVEISEPHGELAGQYRAAYGEDISKKTREDLEAYVKDVYSAEALSKVTHSSGTDLTRDFSLRLEVARGKRGFSSLADAVVAMHPAAIVSRLPDTLLSREEEASPDSEQPGKKTRTHDIFFEPFITEWQYHIVAPPGFTAQPLPANRTINVGPATLLQQHRAEEDGSVSVLWRFDTVKPRYTAEELRAMRKAVAELRNSDATFIRFVQTGAALLAAGRVKESLAAYSALAALHPAEGLHHMQIANAMLTAGLGDQARAEAQKAIELEPNSSLAYQTYAWILEHDLIGRRFEKGFDWEGGIATYRKAKELDPKDYATRANLAILLEYDARGERYSPRAHLDDAIQEYREMAKVDSQHGKQYDDNLLYALFYARRWKEAAEMAASLPGSAARRSLLVAAVAAEQGSEAAIAEAKRRISGDSEQSQALVDAANLVLRLRLYPQGRALLTAAAEGQANAANTRARLQALSTVQPYEKLLLPGTDVRRVIQNLLLAQMDPEFSLEKIYRLVDSDPEDRKDEERRMRQSNWTLLRGYKKYSTPDDVIRDTVIAGLKFAVEGDDASGYRIRIQAFGQAPVTALVARQPEGYRVISFEKGYAMAGAEVLRRIAAGDLQNAKRWLDWLREDISLRAGDDPLGGPVFPRFWTRGDDPDPARMKLAAWDLLADSMRIRDHIQDLKSARAFATDPQQQVNLDLALAFAAQKLRDWPLLQEQAARLLARYPLSDRAIAFLNTACSRTRDWKAWNAAIAARLAKLPDDHTSIVQSAELAKEQGQFEEARTILKKLIDGGRADANDMNLYGWLALFAGNVTDEDITITQQASQQRGNTNFSILHTLACLYAETGKGKEARELLLQAMDAAGLGEPNAAVWYGLGRIAESYGVVSAARADYERMEREPGDELADSTYNLAQARLKQLKAAARGN